MTNKSTYKNATQEKEEKYAETVPQLESLKIFSLVLPKWATENKKDIAFFINAKSDQGDGLEVQTSMSKNGTMEDLEEINYLLGKNEELFRLKFLYHALEEYSKDPDFNFKKATNDLYKKLNNIINDINPKK